MSKKDKELFETVTRSTFTSEEILRRGAEEILDSILHSISVLKDIDFCSVLEANREECLTIIRSI